MEQLIVFLLKNWYLVIIALTFFYQMNSRRKRAGQSAPRPGMPTFGNAPEGAKRPVEARNVQAKPANSVDRVERVRDEFNQSGFAKQTVAPPKQKTSPFPSQASKNAPADSPVYADEISSSSPFLDNPKREQVLQGVVWAEILGPPRSKKPFRR
ncbi:hypothetical protein A8709_24540 [Paenibacillus pectinilyticus]|uniref:Uncharacterized protein n=1 Tax=Paenibacillus pectinilyticus TaxID=512399 RepID=A0A1C1A977_9BACL|nr:hypothetical protein [Paenibacillus pectinilyticus]OCT17152.1 hypothetical protein A8709_24540 [Paenibacillus pectinilyticus]